MKKYILSIMLIGSLVGNLFVPLNAIAASKPYQEMEYDLDIVSEKDWEQTHIGEYPLDVESTSDLSYTGAVAACDMPDEFAGNLSTEELVDYAIEYPFLTDIYFFDSITEGIASLEKSQVFFANFSLVKMVLTSF